MMNVPSGIIDHHIPDVDVDNPDNPLTETENRKPKT
jgi:hypothetical protein